jgi:hypothetical protein
MSDPTGAPAAPAPADAAPATAAPATPVAAPVPGDVQAAMARKAELMGSKEWATKYLSGDVEARRDMASLNATIAAANTASGDPQEALLGAFLVERGRELGCSPEVIEQIRTRPPVTQEEFEMVSRHKRELLSSREFVERLNAGDYEARRRIFTANLVLSSPIKSTAA